MISRPVAAVRAVLVAVLVGAVGLGLVWLLEEVAGLRPVIRDVAASGTRVNILYWGLLAFIGCVALLLGSLSGGVPLVEKFVAGPGQAVGLMLAVLGATVVAPTAGLWAADMISGRAATPLLVGELIGLASAAAYILQRGSPDSADAWPTAGRTQSRSWGSRSF